MDQFIVKPLFGEAGDPVGMLTITNATLWTALAVLCVIALFVLGTRGRAHRAEPRRSRWPNWPTASSTRWSRT